MDNKSKNIAYCLIYFTLLFIWCGSTFAVDFVKKENVHISSIHTIEDDLFTWGSNVTIDGEIKGDLFAGGYKISTNGIIENSANIFAYDYTNSGDIEGSLRACGNQLDIDGTIGRSCILLAQSAKIGKNGVIKKELYFAGESLHLDGTVLENVTIHGQSIYISGTIEGDLEITAANINILPPALIKGNLKYISGKEANIDTKSGVTILGNTTWDLPEKDESSSDSPFTETVKTISKFLAAFLFGIIIMAIGRKYINEMVHQLQTRFAVSAATGFITSIIFFISIFVLILALVLLIAGLSLISEGESFGGAFIFALSTLLVPISSFMAVSGGIVIYSGKIIMALLLGYLITKKIKSNPTFLSKTQFLLGLVILYLLFSIPYLGTLIFIIVTIIGAGAIVLGFKHYNIGLKQFEAKDQIGQ